MACVCEIRFTAPPDVVPQVAAAGKILGRCATAPRDIALALATFPRLRLIPAGRLGNHQILWHRCGQLA